MTMESQYMKFILHLPRNEAIQLYVVSWVSSYHLFWNTSKIATSLSTAIRMQLEIFGNCNCWLAICLESLTWLVLKVWGSSVISLCKTSQLNTPGGRSKYSLYVLQNSKLKQVNALIFPLNVSIVDGGVTSHQVIVSPLSHSAAVNRRGSSLRCTLNDAICCQLSMRGWLWLGVIVSRASRIFLRARMRV